MSEEITGNTTCSKPDSVDEILGQLTSMTQGLLDQLNSIQSRLNPVPQPVDTGGGEAVKAEIAKLRRGLPEAALHIKDKVDAAMQVAHEIDTILF